MKLSNTFVKSLVIVFSQILSRSQISRSQMFFKIGVLKNFIFTGKHLWWSLFLSHFIKKRLQHSCFPVNIAKFLRTDLFKEYFWWLLLSFYYSFYLVRSRLTDLFLDFFTFNKKKKKPLQIFPDPSLNK